MKKIKKAEGRFSHLSLDEISFFPLKIASPGGFEPPALHLGEQNSSFLYVPCSPCKSLYFLDFFMFGYLPVPSRTSWIYLVLLDKSWKIQQKGNCHRTNATLLLDGTENHTFTFTAGREFKSPVSAAAYLAVHTGLMSYVFIQFAFISVFKSSIVFGSDNSFNSSAALSWTCSMDASSSGFFSGSGVFFSATAFPL